MKKLTSYKPALKVLAYFTGLLGIFCVSDIACAASGATIGDVAAQVTGTMSNMAKLISAASYVAGIGFALSGMMKFKAHKDNPQQEPLSKPIVLLVIAAGLVFLPSIIKSAGSTLFATPETGGDTGTINLQ